MPRVPDTPFAAPQVQPLSGPYERNTQTPETLGIGARQATALGQGLTSAGDATLDIANRMQDQENADKLFAADTAFKNDLVKYQAGKLDQKGQSAWGIHDQAANDWGNPTTLDKYYGALTNDYQKRLFKKSYDQAVGNSLNVIAAHEAQQRNVSLEQTAQANSISSINLAAATPLDPAPRDAALKDIDSRVSIEGKINGYGAEVMQAKRLQYTTDLHTSIIKNLATDQPDQAKAYFEANKQQIAGTSYDEMNRLLKTAGTLKTAQDASDALEAMGESEQGGIEYIRKNYEGEDEKSAILEWRQRWADKRAAREGQQKDAGDAAWDTYAKTGKLSSIPASTLDAMDGKVRLALQDYAESAAAGREVKTDFGTWYELKQEAVGNPAQFAKLDLRAYANKIAPNDLKSLADLQGKKEATADAATLSEQLSNVHDQMGWGSGDGKKKGAFDIAVTNAINDEQNRTGKKLDYAQRQQFIDRMVIDGKIKGSGALWDDSGKFYEFQGRGDVGNFEAAIPKTERAKIEAALKRRNLPVTDKNVADLYRAQKGLP